MKAVIRSATQSDDDYQAFSKLFALMGLRDAPPSKTYWDAEVFQSTLLLEEGTEVAGFVTAQVFGSTGFVMNLAVDRERRGRGHGRALMAAVGARLRDRGCSRWELSVRRDNVEAIALYRALGLSEAYRSETLLIDWSMVSTLPSRAATVRSIAPEDDASLERRWDLMEGKLPRSRKMRALLLQAEDSSGCVGIARLMRDGLPRCFPLRVANPDVASPLLEAMHTEVPASAQLSLISDDEALSELLRTRGAVQVQSLVRMRGPL